MSTEKTSPSLQATVKRIGTMHQQVDEYSHRCTERFSEQVSAAINRIVSDTQAAQTTLLAKAESRSSYIEEEYRLKLEQYTEELDAVEVQNLSTMERDLNLRQEMILEEARKRIDGINEEGNRSKLGILREAQALANARIEAIIEQVAALGAEDANRLLTNNIR